MSAPGVRKSPSFSRDRLVANDCAVGLEERYLADLEADGIDGMTVCSLPCISRSAVLIFKPVLGVDNLASHLVTLGHILESWRVQADRENFSAVF